MDYDTNENYYDTDEHYERPVRPIRRKKKRWPIIITCLFLVIVLCGGLYAWRLYSNYKSLLNNLNPGSITANNVEDVSMEPFTIMILGEGTNNYDGESGADSISLLVINPQQKVARLVGVPRDSYLPRGASCSYAGYFDKITNSGDSIECLQDTLEDVFDVEINYYVSINFISFVNIVNALGGVEMDVPDLRSGFEAFSGDPYDGMYLDPALKTGDQWCEHDSLRNAFAVCFNQFGLQTVDGEHALALARSRHYDSDFARNDRQMDLIKAIAKKVTTDFNPLIVNKLLTAADGNIKTNITEEQFLDFARLGKNLFANEESPFAMQSLQLDGAADTFAGDLGEASYNLVSTFSLEDIRMKIAQTLAPNLDVQINIEAFYYDPEMSQYADKFGDYNDYPSFLYDNLDVTDPYTIKQFDYTETSTTSA